MNNSPEFSRRGDTPEQPEQLPGPDIQISGMRASEFSNILSRENDTILAKHVIVSYYVIVSVGIWKLYMQTQRQ